MQTALMAHLLLTSVLLVLLTLVVTVQAGVRAARGAVSTLRSTSASQKVLQPHSA